MMRVFYLVISMKMMIGVVSTELQQDIGSAAGTFRIAKDIIGGALNWATDSIGIAERCPYVDDPIAALMEQLPAHISGQDLGVDLILDAISSWEFSRKAGFQQPLVLAITGPTGVGKSETGFVVAEAILGLKSRIGISRRFLPEGYLVLGGQDYSNTSDAYIGDGNGLPEVHRRINMHITDHLRKCRGSGVIVFDEIQKVVPGALDILVGGLKERGEFRIHKDGKTEVYSTEGVVFILTSDIGAAEMESLMLAYDGRDLIPQHILRAEVKTALDKQWQRLQFGSVVSEVIPYLPLERPQIEQIMALKLMRMSLEYRHMYWLDLCIEESVIQALSRQPYVTYRNRKVKIKMSNGSFVDREKTIAKYGARGIDNGGPIQDLKAKMYKNMQPWKKGSILHIATEGFEASMETKQTPTIVMSWCAVDISMTPTPAEVKPRISRKSQPGNVDTTHEAKRCRENRRVGQYHIRPKHIRSPLCEERWRGMLHDSNFRDDL